MKANGNKLRIRDLRKEKRMTQATLAEAAGVNRITIAKYETGRINPTLESAHKIASALGCTVDDLLKDIVTEG